MQDVDHVLTAHWPDLRCGQRRRRPPASASSPETPAGDARPVRVIEGPATGLPGMFITGIAAARSTGRSTPWCKPPSSARCRHGAHQRLRPLGERQRRSVAIVHRRRDGFRRCDRHSHHQLPTMTRLAYHVGQVLGVDTFLRCRNCHDWPKSTPAASSRSTTCRRSRSSANASWIPLSRLTEHTGTALRIDTATRRTSRLLSQRLCRSGTAATVADPGMISRAGIRTRCRHARLTCCPGTRSWRSAAWREVPRVLWRRRNRVYLMTALLPT